MILKRNYEYVCINLYFEYKLKINDKFVCLVNYNEY